MVVTPGCEAGGLSIIRYKPLVLRKEQLWLIYYVTFTMMSVKVFIYRVQQLL
jgi:hypothetical protein